MVPSLFGSGLYVDDIIQALVTRGDAPFPVVGGPFDLFTFAPGAAGGNEALTDAGLFPWFTPPTLKISFWRPLSSALHWLDYKLLVDAPVALYLHSLLWFAALIVIVGKLYRRLNVTAWAAGLAALAFALEDAHGPTVGWLANRNAIIAATFAFAALIAHDRWRAEGWRAGRVVGPALFAVALLAGEAALGIAGYLFAYAVVLDKGSARARVLSLAPYAAIGLTWLVAYKLMGFGAVDSGMYLDPGADPAAFVGQVATHLPIMLAGQFSGVWTGVLYIVPRAEWTTVALISAGYLLLLLDVLRFTLRDNAHARFWGLGMAVSALPFCSTIPSDRLLVFVGVGAFGLVGAFLAAPYGLPGVRGATRFIRVRARIWIVGLVFVNFVAAPLFAPFRARTTHDIGAFCERGYASLVPAADGALRTAVVVNPPTALMTNLFVLNQAWRQERRFEAYRALASGTSRLVLTRVDARTLEVAADNGFMPSLVDSLFRDVERVPFAVGDTRRLPDQTIRVVSLTDDSRPRAVRFTFDRPLDDDAYAWFVWRDDRFVPFEPPAVGTTAAVEPVDFVKAYFEVIGD